MILVTYRTEDGECCYELDDEKLDELLRRADARFLPAMSGEDLARFERIKSRMRETGNGG